MFQEGYLLTLTLDGMFVAGLKFQLSDTQIFIEYDGARRLTKLKRQN